MSFAYVERALTVSCTVTRNDPPDLVVRAIAEVSGRGWCEATLIPRTTTRAPADGVQELDLVARTPDGRVRQHHLGTRAESPDSSLLESICRK